MEVKVIGEPCGYHGPYTFYKGVRISPISHLEPDFHANSNKNNNCLEAIDRRTAELLRSNDTIIKSIKHEYNDSDSASESFDDLPLPRKFHKNETKPILKAGSSYKKPLVLRLGDCIPVRPWSDSPIACLAELRMVWRDKNEQCLLTSLRLYFLPENTPIGRNCHGEDEVLAIAERVVIKADDLLNWCDDSINWTYGLRANTLLTPNVKDEAKTRNNVHESIKIESNADKVENEAQINNNILCSNIRSLKNSKLDFSEIEREKELYSRTNVAVISYPRYCRYRATLKRLEGVNDEWLRSTLVQALCGFVSYGPNTRVMFCKETFDYPELETHELLCNHLAPKLKGRPRGRGKKHRSDSPSSRIRCDSVGSDSCDSEISACSIEKVYSKYSPLYVKPEFKQGKQVLATRPQLRYNPRPARSSAKCDSNSIDRRHRTTTTTQSDSSDSNDSDSNTNTTNRDDEENESSEESEFVQKLIDFHEAQDSQIPKVFWSGLRRLNLLSIYQRVRQMGGYEMVTEQKMWKYLFGIDGGYNSISRRKYERAILPFEKYENEQMANHMMQRERSGDFNWLANMSLANENRRHLTEAEICEIQRHLKWKEAHERDPNLHLEMCSGLLPVTVIVGNKKPTSPSQFQMQQPHTTITVHQTTIHPQTATENSPPRNPIQITNQIQIQQITVQPSTSREQNSNHKRKSIDEFSGCDESEFVANHLAKLGKTTSLRHVRVKSDRTKDRRSSNSAMHPSSSMIGSITVSAAMKPNEKENIPYLTGSKTTTITPLINNKSMLCYPPTSISDVINLEESDNESGDSASALQSHLYSNNAMFPNMKKRKLDILRQGGLEVTAISNTAGPLNTQGFNHNHGSNPSINVPPINTSKTNNNSQHHLIDIHFDVPRPKFQSKCMYTKTKRIFGNPKDLIPLPAQSTEYNCIDLTVEKCEPTLPIGLHLPQSTTIQKAHSTPTTTQLTSSVTMNRLPIHQPTNSSSLATITTQSRLTPSAALAAQKITDPNLQITLVPSSSSTSSSSSHSHHTSNYNNKHKLNEISGRRMNTGSKTIFDKKTSLHHGGSSLTNTAGQSSSSTGSMAIEPTILNVPNLSTMNDLKINQLLLQNFLNQSTAANAHANQPSKDSNASDPVNPMFLPMLDPVYLSSIYNNPNLFFQQPLPQELLQLYKNFPQGLGIPISKS